MALSQDEYRTRRGCPRCQDACPLPCFGHHGTAQEVRVELTCVACGQVWEEVYTYSHYKLKGKI